MVWRWWWWVARGLRWPRAGAGGTLAIAGLLLGQAPAPAEQGLRAQYLCRGRFDAVNLTALFFNGAPAEVVLLVGESATRLPQLPAASGSRYGSGDQQFWIKGDGATWQRGAAPAYVCGPDPSPPVTRP